MDTANGYDEMQARRLRETSSQTKSLLLARSCPIGQLRRREFKAYTIRQDGKIYFQGAWRGLNSVQTRRERAAKKYESIKHTEDFRTNQREVKKNYYRKHRERFSAERRVEWRTMPSWKRAYRNHRRSGFNPFFGIKKLFKELKAGSIGVLDYVGFIDSKITQLNDGSSSIQTGSEVGVDSSSMRSTDQEPNAT